MQGGLRPEASTGEMGGANGASDRLHALTAGDATTDYAATSNGAGGDVSHLDSFFQGSNWTRDDLVTAATVLNTVLFLTLVYVEVTR